MEIMCPKCGTSLELPYATENGQHFRCSECNVKFMVANGIATLIPFVKTAHAIVDDTNAKVRTPGLTLTAFILFYVEFGVSILGNLADLPGSLTGIASALGCIAFVLCAHKGKNWARITLTSLLGTACLGLLLLSWPLGLICVVINAVPIVFLWLPCSNRWYRAKKASAK